MNTPGRIVFCVALLATSTSARAQSEMTTTKSAIQAEDANPVCIGSCRSPSQNRSVQQSQIEPSALRASTEGSHEPISAQLQIAPQAARRSLIVPNVALTAEGRKPTAQPIGGKDRCDAVSHAVPDDCSSIPEAHSNDFQRPQEPTLSPEAILIDNAGAGKGAGNATSSLPASVLGTVPTGPNGGISIITTPPPR